MALQSLGQNYNPETLNAWLKQNNGFTNNNVFIWGSVAKLGLVF